MKLKLLRWLIPAIVPAALMFGAASPASATSYQCDGPIDPVPTNVMGSVEINVTGDCVIDHDVTATGQIQINITGGKLDARQLISINEAVKLSTNTGFIKARKISAGTTVEIYAGDDNASSSATIEVNDVISNTKDVENINANIILKARGTIKTKDIKANGTAGAGSKKSGGVQIDANLAGDNVLFTVGGAGGIDGSIDTRSKIGGGTESQRVGSGIRITNGKANSTGGITVTDLSKLRVRNSESRSGQIELNANKGTLTLPSGDLNVSEQSNYGAGFIFLLAQKIVTGDGTRLLANQNDLLTPGNVHQVVIAAQTIEYQGAGGLSIEVDGNGAFSTLPATIYVLPQGAIKSDTTDSISNLLWTRTFNGTFFSYPGEVHFNGGEDSPLVLRAHGDNSQIVVTGYPVRFNGGNVTISSRGDGIKNEVILGYGNNQQFNGSPGVTFDNTGTVLLTTKGLRSATRGGLVQVQTDLLKLNATNTIFRADANNDGNADGGRIIVIANAYNQTELSSALFSADAASGGMGNGRTDGLGAVYVVINAALNLGDEPGKLKLTSVGGGNGGNGGKVTVVAQSIAAFTQRSINASASGGNGNGGEIDLTGILTFQNENKQTLRAVGHGEGEGGKLKAFYFTPFDINYFINVDGGDSLAFPGKDGNLNLNLVECQQWRISNSFPKSYWNCAHPQSPETTDEAPIAEVNSLPSTVISDLQQKDFKLYVTSDSTQYVTFFRVNFPINGVGGGTYKLKYIYTAVFRQVIDTNGVPRSPDTNQIKETTAHEVGHAMDLIKSEKSADGAYNKFAQRDFYNLDYLNDSATQGGAIPRDPCIASGTTPAPFAGVIDESTQQPFCDGNGVIAEKYRPGGVLMRNSEIIKTAIPHIMQGSLGNRRELFAQTFAYQGYASAISSQLWFNYTSDGVFNNQHFLCTNSWATSVLNGSSTPPSTAGCSNSVPNWYSTLVNP